MKKNWYKKHSVLLVGFGFVSLIGLILVDHANIHDGILFQNDDFKTAIFSLAKSHEGFILLIGIIGITTVSGHYFWSGKK